MKAEPNEAVVAKFKREKAMLCSAFRIIAVCFVKVEVFKSVSVSIEE
jgi:hypothetical protein